MYFPPTIAVPAIVFVASKSAIVTAVTATIAAIIAAIAPVAVAISATSTVTVAIAAITVTIATTAAVSVAIATIAVTNSATANIAVAITVTAAAVITAAIDATVRYPLSSYKEIWHSHIGTLPLHAFWHMVQYYEIAGKAVSLHSIKLHVCHVAYITRGSKELVILCTNSTVRLKQ
jgi:hypothetical protein